MNATLEAMARALFQSWFVDFDPVRAKLDGRQPIGLDEATAALFPASFHDSAVGHIPNGWRASHLGDVVEVFDSKRIPLSGREREQRKGPYPYHGAASVMDYIDDFLFDGVFALMGEDGSVINDDGCPVMQYVWGKFWVNNHAHVLRGKNGVCTEHVLLHLKNSNIAAFVTGAVQPKLNQGNMNRIPLTLPPPAIGEAFARTIGPLFEQIRANTDQSRTLATLRDMLLPKLLSGELSVSDAT
ncbi:MAG: restriction endonuclease subunit S [Betaproteobacteria bacterium]|nr:restriction endonuclease subunit S [Betaproteobacteria bacterium]